MHVPFSIKSYNDAQNQENKSEETKQASEPDSEVAKVLAYSDWEFKITEKYAVVSDGKSINIQEQLSRQKMQAPRIKKEC